MVVRNLYVKFSLRVVVRSKYRSKIQKNSGGPNSLAYLYEVL